MKKKMEKKMKKIQIKIKIKMVKTKVIMKKQKMIVKMKMKMKKKNKQEFAILMNVDVLEPFCNLGVILIPLICRLIGANKAEIIVKIVVVFGVQKKNKKSQIKKMKTKKMNNK